MSKTKFIPVEDFELKEYIFFIFGGTFTVEERDQCIKTSEHLKEFKSAKTHDLIQLKKYIKTLEEFKDDTSKFLVEIGGADEHNVNGVCEWVEKELELVDTPLTQYNSSYVSLLHMSWTVDICFDKHHRSETPFYDCLKLAKQINSFYSIKEPTKAPNKVAYGWKFAIEKDSRPYLFGCLKNYLAQNGVEPNSVELRKIVGLLSCENGDE